MTMQTKHKFTAAKVLAAVLCLMIALTSIHLITWAVDLNQSNSLTVTTEGEIEGADIEVDIYQLASATAVDGVDTYGYAFLNDFAGIKIGKETEVSALASGSVSLSDEQWEKLAQDASLLVQQGVSQQPRRIAIDGSVNDLPAGLYLIIARDADLQDYWATAKDDPNKLITVANSDYYQYSFSPALVSLPTKEAQADEAGNLVIGTAAEFGDWLYGTTVYMKSGVEPLYGSIQITKNIDRFEGSEEATFVFEVTADGTFADEEEYHYSTTAMVSFNASTGLSSTVTVDHLRAGATVQVREVYDGLRYTAETLDWKGPQVVTADSPNKTPVTFTFTNYFDDDYSGGHGIQNHFSYESTSWTNAQQTAASGLYR